MPNPSSGLQSLTAHEFIGDKPFRLLVFQDGKPLRKQDTGRDLKFDGEQSHLLIDKPRMYSITVNKLHGDYVLKLLPESDAFLLFSFTFSSCESPPE